MNLSSSTLLFSLSAGCCVQEHAAWLEEPQELTSIDSTKTDPLLGDSSHGGDHAGLKVDKDSKKGQALESMPDGDVTDSAAQKKITDKLSQV